MSKETGGPAFPIFPDTGVGHAVAFQGMTLRDYFAAKAMNGAISYIGRGEDQKMAEWAYKMADLMLAARGSK